MQFKMLPSPPTPLPSFGHVYFFCFSSVLLIWKLFGRSFVTLRFVFFSSFIYLWADSMAVAVAELRKFI